MEAEIFWDDNMELFGVENYFPDENNKRVNDGQWIKIRTQHGYEVHYAKKSSRKLRYGEQLSTVCNKLQTLMNGEIKKLMDKKTTLAQIEVDENQTKFKKLKDKKAELSIRIALNLPLYEVRIQRSRSKVEYYLPYQYEIVNDIEELTEYYMGKVTGVEIKPIYTAENYDKVHYLMSRGISRRMAEIMATLNQSYFSVNMTQALDEYNKQWTAGIKSLVEKI
jgi:hypothetical protein